MALQPDSTQKTTLPAGDQRSIAEYASVGQLAIYSLKRCRRGFRVADSLGTELSGKALLMRALALRHHLRSQHLAPSETNVGILLPPSVAATVCNLALTLDKRVVINLNYTLGEADVQNCIRQTGIKHVLTSDRFLKRVNLSLQSKTINVEDLAASISKRHALSAAIDAYITPVILLERKLGLRGVARDDLLTIIFTSGSTGEPKGVMLSHGNIAHNLSEIGRVGALTSNDVLLGVLPFFHSFGFTAALWAVLTQNTAGVFHYNPLEMERIGELAAKYRATILHSTPSLLRRYLRRITPQQFEHLDFVLVGSEPMPSMLADDFESKFGTRPVDAYGTTETSPLISFNVPASRSPYKDGFDRCQGSVGLPAIGVEVKIVGADDGKQLGVGLDGHIFVRGPNVMLGYLSREDLIREVLCDGWYKTGDIGHLDADGFLFITGRASRFSKIGGEMVPHIKLEQQLGEFLRNGDDDDVVRVAVTGFQAADGEEHISVFYCHLDKTPTELREHLLSQGFPKLHVPKEKAFLQVKSIPSLGTGKLDLRAVNRLAVEAFGNGSL